MFLVGDLQRAFSGLGSGLAHGVRGFGRRIKKFGEEDDSQAALPVTPSFNRTQNPGVTAQQGVRGIEDSVAAAENRAREDYGASKPLPLLDDGGLPDLPISRRDLTIPALTPPPSSAELRSGLPILPAPRKITPAAALPPAVANMEAPRIEMDLDRRNLPIPSLPGRPGGPRPYNRTDAEMYDYVMKGARRDAEGRLLGKEEGGGFDRDWKQTAISALAGAARGFATTGDVGGAIGGAAAGGAGSLINPQAGREFVFDSLHRPELERREARERAERDRAVADILNRAKLDDLRATTEERRAQAEKLRRPEAPRSPIRSDRGLWDPATGGIIPGTEPLPKERPQALKEGPDGNWYDVNIPADKAKLEALNTKLPRDRFGRFISRADERATARSGAGGGDKDSKALQKAMEDFDRTKDALVDATRRGDGAMMIDLRRRLRGMAASLASRFGDRLEVGGGDWPYYRPRDAQGASPGSMSRAEAKRKLMAEGYSGAEAESELDRLGVR